MIKGTDKYTGRSIEIEDMGHNVVALRVSHGKSTAVFKMKTEDLYSFVIEKSLKYEQFYDDMNQFFGKFTYDNGEGI